MSYAVVQVSHSISSGTNPNGGAPSLPSLYAVLANLIWAGWGYHSNAAMVLLSALWPLGILGILLVLGKGRSLSMNMLVALVVIPVTGAYLLTTRSQTFFELRYFISVVPALVIIAARATTGWLRSRVGAAVAVGTLAMTLLVGLADEQFDGGNPRLFDNKGAFGFVQSQLHTGDVLLLTPSYLMSSFDYYGAGIPAEPIVAGGPLPRQVGGKTFLMGSFLYQPDVAAMVRQTLAQLASEGRSVIQIVHKDNVTIWVLQ
jgi:hypothetical protein